MKMPDFDWLRKSCDKIVLSDWLMVIPKIAYQWKGIQFPKSTTML